MNEPKQNKDNWFKKHKILTVIGSIILFFIIVGAASGGSKNSTPTSTQKTTDASTTTEQVKKEEKPAWDAQAIYDKLQNSMNKADAETVIGKTGENCSTSDTPGVGTMEFCLYNGDFGSKGSISITYLNGTIYSKTKTGF